MKRAALLLILISSGSQAFTMSQMEEKQDFLQKLSIMNPVKLSAINLADQVVMFECKKTMTANQMKRLSDTREIRNLESRIIDKKGLIGLKEAKQILTHSLITKQCN